MVSSNLNSNLLRFHCVHSNLSALKSWHNNSFLSGVTRQNQTQFYNRQNNNISSGSSYNSSSATKTSTPSKFFRPYSNNQSRPSTPSRTAFGFKPKTALLKADKKLSSSRPLPIVATNDNQLVENLAEQQQQHICQLHNDTLVQCLEKNGVYVCKSYGPRCFIIQKVRKFSSWRE